MHGRITLPYPILWVRNGTKRHATQQVSYRNQIQQKLLNEGSSLTLERALSTAISTESLINQSSLINQHQQQVPVSREEEPTSIFKTTESKPDKSCYRCNGNHKPETCSFKDKECFYCKAEGRKI